jgi:hypothetical protein
MICNFVDWSGHAHTLDLDAVLVDGMQCTGVQSNEHYVLFETAEQGTITCLLESFWREIAGSDLSAQKAGLLLAECLVRQVVIQRTSAVLHEVMCQLTRITALPAEIPLFSWLTTRLDPFVRQAMSAYDGSDAMTDMLVRILHQSPTTIRAWAHQLGLESEQTQAELTGGSIETALEITAAPLPHHSEPAEALTRSEQETSKQFRWSRIRLDQLDQALETCTGGTVLERSQDIANRYGWPVEKVRNKLYELQQTANHAGNPAAREAESSEQKEDDRGDPLETISVE